MKSGLLPALALVAVIGVGCGGEKKTEAGTASENAAPTTRKAMTYAQDVEFLKKHTDAIVLGGETGPSVCVVPQYQARVMTSSTDAKAGDGNGWINYELIESGKPIPHINPFGGEDRFWMGPEGGQFAIFFKKGDKFDLDAWQTPAFIDTEGYKLVSKSENEASFEYEAKFDNYSGTSFDAKIGRTVKLLSADDVEKTLGVKAGEGVTSVAYESRNTVTNAGSAAWTKDTGLLSIWILGMFKHSPTTHVVIPFKTGPEAQLGPVVNDAYFGKVPADRLKVMDDLIVFKGDGQYRSKIGVSPKRVKPILGSYDPARGLLTVVQFTLPEGATDYVNSMWELQDQPFAGDVVNSYNDGPPGEGKKPLGPFYELETSSPALALTPGASATHVHRTFHFRGSEAELQKLATKLFGADLKKVSGAFEAAP